MSSPGVTPNDVHSIAFRKPPIGSRGYSEDEVDAFLDRAEKDLEAGLPLDKLVRSARFGKPPLGKRGYDMAEVDAFLDRLAGTAAREVPPTATTTSVEQPFVEQRGFLARLLGRR